MTQKMSVGLETNITRMLQQIVFALKAFAKMYEVDLAFQSDHKKLIVSYNPEEIINTVIRLIFRIVVYTPSKQSILVKLTMNREPYQKYIIVEIHVSGINLSRISQITNDIKHPVTAQSTTDCGTVYQMKWPITQSGSSANETNYNPQILPSFYAEIRRHLQSYFTKSDKLIAALSSRHPKEAAFLQKVNKLILANIDKDGFNSNHLSAAMGMSRTQLYRRLHPIIRQAPGGYIQTIRIQRAKELLETTDMRVGEVAFNTGFQTPSHFTRVFIKHYGVRPSIFCRKAKM